MKKALFTASLVIALSLSGILAYSIWKGKFLTPQGYFESGKKYYDQGKYSEAVIQFSNAIRKDSRYRDARYFLALTFEQQKDLRRAAASLGALLEYYPDDATAALELGHLYLTIGQVNPEFLSRAKEVANNILAKDQKNSKALVLLGNVYTSLKDYASATGLYEEALRSDPKNTEALLALGATQGAQKNNTEAEQALLKARELDPGNKDAIALLSTFYRSAGKSKQEEAIVKEALSLDPSDPTNFLRAVGFYDKAGRLDEVEKILRAEQTKRADDPGPSLLLVDFFDSKNRPADAEKLLSETKQKFPKSLDVAEKIALRFLKNQPDRARPEIEQILKAEPNNIVGNILLGELYVLTGQYDAAEAAFGKKSVLDGRFPQPHYFLGKIAFKKGQQNQAVDHYQKALAINRNFLPARVELADVLLNSGRLADSREEIGKALAVDPAYPQARIVKVALDRADNKGPIVEQELKALMKELPGNPIVYRQMALYSDSLGKAADAEENYLLAFELQPGSETALRELTAFYIRQKQTDRAIQKLSAIPDEQKQALHYELLGMVYSQAGKMQDAEKAYKTALQKDPSRTNADLYLFNDYMRTGRTDEGLQRLNDILKQNPKDSSTLTIKGTVYESQGRIEEAKQTYTEVLKIDPNADVAANNLAGILADEGRDLQSALQYAQIVKKKRPESPSAADTLGWVYYKLGNYILAREQARFAVSKEPDNGTFLYHLGLTYKGASKTNEAMEALKKAVSTPKDFKERSLAQAALKEIAKTK